MFIRSDRHLGESPKLSDSVVWLLRMGYEMQRDDDYVRELLLAIEASDDWIVFLGYIDEFDQEQPGP